MCVVTVDKSADRLCVVVCVLRISRWWVFGTHGRSVTCCWS
jgi:hypothetical protein